MKIIEQFLCGKKNTPETCEDGLVISNQLIAVIDGVTAKGKRLWNKKSSGCFAKDVLSDYLSQDIIKQNAIELLTNLDTLLKKQYQSVQTELSCDEYPRASVIIYNDFYKEIWSYGDCQCMINQELYTHTKKIDQLNADLRALRLEYEFSRGADMDSLTLTDPGRAYIQENLSMQFAFENKIGAFGYPVLNGMGIEESMLKRYPVSTGDTIILASDGYPVLCNTLKKSEAELSLIHQKDPLCFRLYRSTKGFMKDAVSFDDRCYCRFIV